MSFTILLQKNNHLKYISKKYKQAQRSRNMICHLKKASLQVRTLPIVNYRKNIRSFVLIWWENRTVQIKMETS